MAAGRRIELGSGFADGQKQAVSARMVASAIRIIGFVGELRGFERGQHTWQIGLDMFARRAGDHLGGNVDSYGRHGLAGILNPARPIGEPEFPQTR